MSYYFESLFNEDLTFIFGWEAFVFFMLCMFVSIIVGLHRIEKKVNNILDILIGE